MHETQIIKNILKQVDNKAEGKKVKSITVEVGDLAHLPAEGLKDFLTEITDYEVIVKQVKAKVKCECGYEGEPRIFIHKHDFSLYECPKCKRTPKVLSGKDIILKEIKTH